MASDVVVALLVVAVVALVVFLIFREFWTWYWKQSEQVELLKRIARSLQLLEERGRPLPPSVVLPPAPVRPERPQARGRTWLERLLNEDPQAGRTFS